MRAIGGAIGGAGGGAVGGAVGGAGGGFAGGFTGSQYGNDYEPEQSSTPEEPVETVKVEVDAAPTPSARDKAESFVESVTHGFKQDSGEELVGRAATPEEVAAFRQKVFRIKPRFPRQIPIWRTKVLMHNGLRLVNPSTL